MRLEYRNKKLSRHTYIINEAIYFQSNLIALTINERQEKISLEMLKDDGSTELLPAKYLLQLNLEIVKGNRIDCTLFWNKNAEENYQLFLRVNKTGEMKFLSLSDARMQISRLAPDVNTSGARDTISYRSPAVTGNIWHDVKKADFSKFQSIAKQIENELIAEAPKLHRITKTDDNVIGSSKIHARLQGKSPQLVSTHKYLNKIFDNDNPPVVAKHQISVFKKPQNDIEEHRDTETLHKSARKTKSK